MDIIISDPQTWIYYLPILIPLIFILLIWDTTWKLIGLWKAARNRHLGWFILIALLNTMGILPIIYILLQKTNKDIA